MSTTITIPVEFILYFVFSSTFEYNDTIESSGRRTRRALKKREKYCPLSKIEVK